MHPRASTSRAMAAARYSALTQKLKNGPVQTMMTLQVKALALAADIETNDDRIQHLADLVYLAQVTMTQFHEFTLELKAMIVELEAEQRDQH